MKMQWVLLFEKVAMPLFKAFMERRASKKEQLPQPTAEVETPVEAPAPAPTPAPDQNTKNMRAFLDVIAFAEGTDNGKQRTNDRGYDVLVGGGNFNSYKDHPRKSVSLPKLGIHSTAAGRYQILAWVFDHYKRQLGLADFSPESQDRIARQLVRECRAVDDVHAGRIEAAVTKCRSRWASFPGAGYGQHEQKMTTLTSVFYRSGGVSDL